MIASMVAGAALVAHWSEDADLAAALERSPRSSTLPAPTRRPEIEDTLASENFALRHRPRRDLRGRHGGGAEAQGDVGDPRRSVLLGRGAAWARRRRHARLSGARLRARAGDAARDGFFETVDRLASFGAAPLLVDVEINPRWPTLVAPDARHRDGHADRGPARVLRACGSDRAPPRPQSRSTRRI